MADISKIKLPGSSTIYHIKDQGARDLISALPKPMVFKGTLGSAESGATITSLPTATVETIGHTYKVITEGTYAGKHADVGDLFIGAEITKSGTTTYEWVLVPSGDEPGGSGTVTSITAGTGLAGGTITTSGTISHATTTAVAAAAVKVGKDNLGHVVVGEAITTDDITGVAEGGNDIWFLNCGTSTTVV